MPCLRAPLVTVTTDAEAARRGEGRLRGRPRFRPAGHESSTSASELAIGKIGGVAAAGSLLRGDRGFEPPMARTVAVDEGDLAWDPDKAARVLYP